MVGNCCLSSAAAPATTGEANEVPAAAAPNENVIVRSGATSSGLGRPSFVGPRLEKASSDGVGSVFQSACGIAPTVNAPCATAGSTMLEDSTRLATSIAVS